MEVNTTPLRAKWVTRIIFALCLASTQPIVAAADPGPAPPLMARPFTFIKMLETQMRYVPSIRAKYSQAELEAQTKIAAVLPGGLSPFTGGSPPPMDRGADIGEMVENVLNDFKVILGEFLDCLDYGVVGVCMRISFPEGVRISYYREYRLPVQNVEVVQTPFKSGFIPKVVNNLILPVVEDTYYPLAEDIASTSMQWTSEAVETQASIIGADFQDAPSGLEGSSEAEDKVKTIEEKKRFRNYDPVGGGVRFAEYTVFPQVFHQVMGSMSFFCHDILSLGVWSSYYPLTIMPARMTALSFFFFPLEMINKFLVPNTCAGVNNQVRGGRTPLDMLMTGNSSYDAMQIGAPGMGCLKENDGGYVPVTNYTQNSSFPVATANAVIKGIKIASMMMPAAFYSYNLKEDRNQYSQNKRMPRTCQKIEKFVRDFNDAHMKKGKDNWNVGMHWKRFRCCPRGYFLVWGIGPIIKR